jgi:hypothetical protein
MADEDRTASLMSPRKLAQIKPKPAATPAAWLDQMAADAGHQHVARSGDLARMLRKQGAVTGLAALQSQLQQLAAVLPGLDFALLEPRGWWARTSGKSRRSGTEFGAQFEPIDAAASPLGGLAQALGRERQVDAALIEHSLVELEVESAAIEKIIEQGTRWLQDMRNQLKQRQAGASEVTGQQAVLEDSKRCDILVERLKLLRGLCNAAAQVVVQTRALGQRHAGLARNLQPGLTDQVKEWHKRIGALVHAADAGEGPTLGLEGPMGVHEELIEAVARVGVECEQLRLHAQNLASSLAALDVGHAPSA